MMEANEEQLRQRQERRAAEKEEENRLIQIMLNKFKVRHYGKINDLSWLGEFGTPAMVANLLSPESSMSTPMRYMTSLACFASKLVPPTLSCLVVVVSCMGNFFPAIQ